MADEIVPILEPHQEMTEETSLITSPILDQLAVLQKPIREEKRITARKLAEKRITLYYLEHKFSDAVERFKKKNGDIIIPDKEFPSILKRAKRYYGLLAHGTATLGVFSGLGFILNLGFISGMKEPLAIGAFVFIEILLSGAILFCSIASPEYYSLLHHGRERSYD